METARHELAVVPENVAGSIEDSARRQLASNFHFHGCDDKFTFAFDSPSGVLIVQGTVPSFYLKQLVQTVLKKLHGVARIDNRLLVVASTAPSYSRVRIDDRHYAILDAGHPRHGQRT